MPLGERAPQTVLITSPLNPMPPHQLEDDEMQRQQRIDQTHFDHRPVALGADSMLANSSIPRSMKLWAEVSRSTFEVIVSVN